MPSRVGEFVKLLFRNWHIKLLAVFSALLVWLYVEVKTKVPFQVQVEITDIPKGYRVFPKEILITGEIAEKFHREDILRCFKVYLVWNGKGKYATVRVKAPLPKPFVEIESVYPQRVEIERVSR